MKTASVLLALVLISCSGNRQHPENKKQDYYPTYTQDLEDSVRVLELMNTGVMCQCANWSDENVTNQVPIFIEPLNNSLILPDSLGYPGDVLKFTGQFYKDNGYPKYFPITEESVTKARVFRYNKFEVMNSNYRDYVSDTTNRIQ